MFACRVCLAGALFLQTAAIVAAADRIPVFRPIPDVGEPFDVNAFASAKMPYRDNAFTAYRHAAVILQFPYDSMWLKKLAFAGESSDDLPEQMNDTLSQGWSKADATVRRWLAACELPLQIWERGTECKEARQRLPGEINRWESEDDELPAELAKLACLKAAQLIAAKRARAAWPWYCAVLRASGHFQMHSGLAGRNLGQSVYRIGARGICFWSALPEVTADDLHKALADVLAIHAKSAPLSDSLKHEYYAARRSLESGKYDPYDMGGWGQPLAGLGSDVRAHKILNLVYTNLFSQADRPRSERPPFRGQLHLFSSGKRSPQGPRVYSDEEIEQGILSFRPDASAAMNFLPDETAFDAFDQERLEQAGTVLALSLQLYEREHGEFPAQLDRLVACGYLRSVPVDPFSTGGPLRYRREADSPGGALLWSIRDLAVDASGKLDESRQVADEEEPTSFRIAAPKR